MAWVNVLDVAGISASIEYPGGTPSPLATITGGKLVIPSGYPVTPGVNAVLAVADTGGTLAATPEYPAIDLRVTVNRAGMTDTRGLYKIARVSSGFTAGSWIYDSGDQSDAVLDGVYSGGTMTAGIGVDGSGGGDISGATLMIEVDITEPDPVVTDFWGEFVGTEEIVE